MTWAEATAGFLLGVMLGLVALLFFAIFTGGQQQADHEAECLGRGGRYVNHHNGGSEICYDRDGFVLKVW